MSDLGDYPFRNDGTIYGGPKEREVIQICSWCLPRRIRVLNEIPAAGLVFTVDEATGHVVRVTRGQAELILSNGICSECSEKLRPEPVLEV